MKIICKNPPVLQKGSYVMWSIWTLALCTEFLQKSAVHFSRRSKEPMQRIHELPAAEALSGRNIQTAGAYRLVKNAQCDSRKLRVKLIDEFLAPLHVLLRH